MPRYKIIIEYDGTKFAGWQRQLAAPSVQQAIEEAIEKFSGEIVVVHAAGRTDAGVHALGQVAHFDLDKHFPPDIIQRAINHFLRLDKIVITEAQEVDNDFHARFSAVKRYYEYVIINRKAPLALELDKAWHIRDYLDVEKMQEAANILIGKHDFTSFRASQCQANSPVKTLDEIKVFTQGQKVIFSLKATSFLHHMVRNIVGSLKLVGVGKWEVEQMAKALAAKNRSEAGPTAPACGLYFTKVEYTR